MRNKSFLFSVLLLLVSCTPSAGDVLHTKAEAYIHAHISELSPTPAVLGGTFSVTNVQWEDADTAIVSYEDGHIALSAKADVQQEGNDVHVSSFVLIQNGGSPQRAGAKEGEFCGGIAAFQCTKGLTCKFEGEYPDAGGVCVKE